MPRKTRMYVPGIPVHIVQRGNNRQATFFDDDDYQFYLEALKEGAERYGAAVHAYVLMTNHVHLLITPEFDDSLSRTMQHVGRMYVVYVNKKYRRSGTLWEGRHKGSMVDEDNYLLACYRYIEMNPVVAGMVEKPEEYRWSSYRRNGVGLDDSVVASHTLYSSLGITNESRLFNYRSLFVNAFSAQEIHEIRECLEGNYPLGNSRFKEEIEIQLERKVGYVKRGRPAKVSLVK